MNSETNRFEWIPEGQQKPCYILGRTTIERVANEGQLDTENVAFVAADELFHQNPYATHARELLQARLAQEKERDEWRHLITTVISAAKGWFHEHDMYRGAWLREMGGEIRRKTHEIDGFVLRTRDIYEGYKQVPELKQRISDLESQLAALPERKSNQSNLKEPQ